MLVVTIVFVFVVFLAFLDSKGRLKHGLEAGFVLLVVFFSFRVQYGNDYSNYLRLFNTIGQASSFQEIQKQIDIEFGWLFLNYYSQWLGFHFMLFLHLVLLLYPIYYLIKRYVPRKYYWISAFILCFHPSIFLLDLSMMRQSLAVSYVALSFSLVMDKKYLKTVICFLLAYSFHNTALIAIPFLIILRFIRWIDAKYIIYGGLTLYIVLMVSQEVLGEYTSYLMTLGELQEEYGSYNTKGELGSGYGIILQFLFLLPAYVYHKNINETDRSIIFLYLIGFLFVPFSTVMVLYGRLTAYFMVYVIVLVPRLLVTCKNKAIYIFTLSCVMVYFLYSYYAFFYSDTYGAAYINYHSMFLF